MTSTYWANEATCDQIDGPKVCKKNGETAKRLAGGEAIRGRSKIP
jgi:hypothetical protein